MALLRAADANTVRQRFHAELVGDVTIKSFTASAAGLAVPGWECEYCPVIQHLLEELVALDPRLKLEVHSVVAEQDGGRPLPVERVPAIIIGGQSGSGIRFYGIPSGFEFAVLIDDLIAVSRSDSGLAPETRQALGVLTQDVHIQPPPVRTVRGPGASLTRWRRSRPASTPMSSRRWSSPRWRTGTLCTGVPKIVLNETRSFEGALPEAAFLSHVMAAAAERGGQFAAQAARG